ncbi:hypothetical protein [Gimibacter soli]|uniref:Uncharacterized protein n=1 Tax=Gimibacter soli TaxID=3024400 RepID=A0AAF0BJ95_9PROT|nr:hypothetical protein [Gimibacter soli]WCL52859.1 hypothetical protein PH603_09935 [Gimibacter soli]
MARTEKADPQVISKNIRMAAILSLMVAAPAAAQSELETGFEGALAACREWINNPASWQKGPQGFMDVMGMGDRLVPIREVIPPALPPESLRVANAFWRIKATDSAGYVLVVSGKIPMCHITGGGNADLQPAIEAVLASPRFTETWEPAEDLSNENLASTMFQDRQEPAFTIVITRALGPGERQDRTQLIATAVFNPEKAARGN